MSVLILQVLIKQWDRSQRTETHAQLRDTIPDHYPLNFPPAFYIVNQTVVIDQHGDDIQGNRLKYSLTANGKLLLDRFQICLNSNTLTYLGAKANERTQEIGTLNNQWLQCTYNWRYSIFESDRYYWLYEEVTLNAIRLDKLNKHIFLNTQPATIFKDINDLDTIKKS